MPTLMIIQGFIAAGKTTVSKRLAEETGAVRLNADEWCEENFPQEELSRNWDVCFGQAVTQLWLAAEDHLGRNEDVILDIGFWDIASRDHARQKAAAWNVDLIHYHVHAPDEVLLERMGSRSGGIAAANISRFSELKQLFSEPEAREGATRIDN